MYKSTSSKRLRLSNESSHGNSANEIMSLDDLPDELLVKIFCYLSNDFKSFISLSSTSRRLNRVCDIVINSPEWSENRPTIFNMYLDMNSYLPSTCSIHLPCDEQQWRSKTKCELQARNLPPANIDCYYHRLYCLVTAKYRKFSSIKLRDARLSDRGCIKSFRDAKKMASQSSTSNMGKLLIDQNKVASNIRAIVELELHDCEITMDWLNTALNALDNIKYLVLNNVAFTDPTILVESRFYASKSLIQLKITGDRTFRMNDSIFMYFLDNFPATCLDISATRVEFHKRVIQRFYPNANTVDLYSARPSEYILTFPMIFLYLKKYQTVVKEFVANETNITFSSLKRILQDDELKHIKIIIQNCPMITHVERARLSEQVESDLFRITF